MVDINDSTYFGSASTALRTSSVPALRGLSLATDENGLVLTGSVSSYYHKQLAQETVLPFLSERRLFNRVVVAH